MADFVLYDERGKMFCGRAGLELWMDDRDVRVCFLPDEVDRDGPLSLFDFFIMFEKLHQALLLTMQLTWPHGA